MHFLEKDLETIIWENYEACYERGLDIEDIASGNYINQLKFRQLQLGPYGVADLVNIRYYPTHYEYTIQVIECKRNEINLSTYGQARRYFNAIKDILKSYFPDPENKIEWSEELVLIGRTFDSSGDFPFIYNNDVSCKAFTYSYEIDGLKFTPIEHSWARSVKEHKNVLMPFAQSVFDMIKATDRADEANAEEWRLSKLENGDPTQPLLVTSSGILINTALLDRSAEYGY